MNRDANFHHSDFEPEDEENISVRQPEMVRIPAGDFWMGTGEEQITHLLEREEWATEWFNSDLFSVEQPIHVVTLPDYEIAKTPVTNTEFYSFTFNTGYKVPKHWVGFRFLDGLEEHPVTNISRVDAEAYIQWLNKSCGQNYRLPSEAEWEKASRGQDKRIYPWGDNFDPWRCNTAESGKKSTTPIRSYSPGGDSPYDVSDMAGNVWEWTSSRMLPYSDIPEEGRETKAAGAQWVVRGGAWYYSRAMARCSSREGVLDNYISPALGFRLARSVKN